LPKSGKCCGPIDIFALKRTFNLSVQQVTGAFLRMKTRNQKIAIASAAATTAVTILSASLSAGVGDQVQVPTSSADFFQLGTQPVLDGSGFELIQPSSGCSYCHGGYSNTHAPYDSWVASLMGQSARDPVWKAALAIANQDAHLSGEFCIRCHAPAPWINGRSSTGDLSLFEPDDFDGINCHFCHRTVDPNPSLEGDAQGYPENFDLTPDPEVLAPLIAANLLPSVNHGNATFVVDPADVRRGPFADVPQNFHGGNELVSSPYHRSSSQCGTCHDVGNPIYSPGPNGELVLNALGQPHPTMNKNDMFPEQRTYSEWLNSTFATDGVYFADRRFGGNHPTGVMKTCQDCHMPDQAGGGCVFYDDFDDTVLGEFERPNVPQHSFAGANTWVIRAVATQMGDDAEFYGLTPDRVDASVARNVQMLRDASDMELTQEGSSLKVRITNQSGHKLPTGFPEGRRAWLNVKFFDSTGGLLSEFGAYDATTATLTTEGTKVYRAQHAISDAVAAATHLPVGAENHLALSNVIVFDNRIPPRGFTNAAFAGAGAAPVGYSYADGQYWDDSFFSVPSGAVSATVTFYFQTSTREYMEHLRDTALDGSGLTVYNLWVQHGKSAPVSMDSATIQLSPSNPADLDGNGLVNGADLAILLSNWNGSGFGDLNGDGVVNGADLAGLLGYWTG
jgi:hypothetical protein